MEWVETVGSLTRLVDLAAQVGGDGERRVLTVSGEPLAIVIPYADLEALETGLRLCGETLEGLPTDDGQGDSHDARDGR